MFLKPTLFARKFSTELPKSQLKTRLADLIKAKQQQKDKILKTHGDKVIGKCTVSQAYGGARDVKCLVTETSLLDAQEGIRFRGYTVFECQEKLTKAPGGSEPLPEALFYLLLTGEIPTSEQTATLQKDIMARGKDIPEHVLNVIKALPPSTHPMTQFSVGINALQTKSKFAKAYASGSLKKNQYWEYTLEDSLDLIGALPTLAALIFNHSFRGQTKTAAAYNPDLDWSANFCRLLGFNKPAFDDLMRLYLTAHSDHEGGNVSAHTTHLVGSALSDPYLSFAAGMNGLAGPLHGLANQEVLAWLIQFQKNFGSTGVTDEAVKKALWDTLNKGQVIPGFGHAVLRKTDPRYTVFRQFALKHLPEDPLFKVVAKLFEHAPPILTQHGKTKNPWPNVDAHSGVLLTHYGMHEHSYYTVLFGVSRALGVLASLVWDRALGLPLERPKSVTSDWIEQACASNTHTADDE